MHNSQVKIYNICKSKPSELQVTLLFISFIFVLDRISLHSLDWPGRYYLA